MRYTILLALFVLAQDVYACADKKSEAVDNLIACRYEIQNIDSTGASFVDKALVVKGELERLKKSFMRKVIFGSKYDEYVSEAREKGGRLNEAWKRLRESPMDKEVRLEYVTALDSIIVFAERIRE